MSTVEKVKKCEICRRKLIGEQERFCSKPCQYKGRWANRDLAGEWRGRIQKLWSMVKKNPGNSCWLWGGGKTAKGYGKTSVGGIELYVHRFVFELKHGKIPRGKQVLHSCDVRNCVRHLFLGTPKMNSEDMVKKGRSCRGSRKPNSKLTESAVAYIKKVFKRGNGGLLARYFGVTRSVITSIIYGRSWRHVR